MKRTLFVLLVIAIISGAWIFIYKALTPETPKEVAVNYIKSFHSKDVNGMRSRLHDDFLENFKKQFEPKLDRYDAETMRTIFGVSTKAEVMKLSADDLYSKTMAAWKQAMDDPTVSKIDQSIDLEIGTPEVESISDNECKVTLKTTVTAPLSVATDTEFRLVKVGKDWKIHSFNKVYR